MNSIRVEIGGIGICLRYKNSRIKEETGELYAGDFIHHGKNNIIIDVMVGSLPAYPKKKVLFEAKENWRLYDDNGGYAFEMFQSGKDGKRRITSVCFMEKGLSGGRVYILPERADNGRNWSLEQLMKILGHLITISVLHRYQGTLIHSSGIILDKKGIIFSGTSGAGKTTLAKLWQKRGGVTVLSDDRVIVRKVKGKYFIYGTPWPGEGEAASPESAPLKKILFLSQAKQNRLIPMERKEGARRLIAQCFPVLWAKESIDFVIKFCGMLVKDIPCFSFGFIPNQSAVEFIENNC